MFRHLRNHLISLHPCWLLAVALALVLPRPATAATQVSHAARSDRIIISGAAGHLGELTVDDLLARSIPASRLILVSRTPSALARYARLGASVRYGDFTKPSSLRKAFAGGNRMLLISIGFGSMPRPEAHGNAIAAAIADGVKHIAYTSWIALSRGDRSGIGADHYATEEMLKHSGVAWTMLRNSEYMEELLPDAEKMFATGRARVPPGDLRVGYVSRSDCAAAAAAVLSTPGHDYKVYNITGQNLVNTRDLAAAVSAVTGKAIRNVAINPGPAPANSGLGSALSVVSDDVAELTGKPPMTLKSFLRQHEPEILHQNR
ncbi:MAG TPA: NAD(P)H-binding protein [Steroidobacteraceae bacterium]|jgi:NAD(P)H dehydrogenase (quinone)|nr:NAD(P)H-binding protein [Steroidobacteraceae bacterium]